MDVQKTTDALRGLMAVKKKTLSYTAIHQGALASAYDVMLHKLPLDIRAAETF